MIYFTFNYRTWNRTSPKQRYVKLRACSQIPVNIQARRLKTMVSRRIADVKVLSAWNAMRDVCYLLMNVNIVLFTCVDLVLDKADLAEIVIHNTMKICRWKLHWKIWCTEIHTEK